MALFIGTFVALAALSFVLYPLLISERGAAPEWQRTESHRGDERFQALNALKDIELDWATGKLSQDDYSLLVSSYTQRAADAMQKGSGAICEQCGPRPEADARFCSSCGRPVT